MGLQGPHNMSSLCWTLLVVMTLFPASGMSRRLNSAPATPATETTTSQGQEPADSAPIEAFKAARKQIADPTGTQGGQTEGRDLAKALVEDSIYARNGSRGALGSSPPTCRMKCGLCHPCKAVHVVITTPHGVITNSEYYPEAWRCQCGNNLFLP